MHSKVKLKPYGVEEQAWAMFMAAAMTRLSAAKAAVEADVALKEFRSRQTREDEDADRTQSDGG